jgi:hypothetical protein
MAHLIWCACTLDNMWYVETFIWLRYKPAQGILPVDRFVKPIKCLTSTRRDAGRMWTLRRRGPAGAVSGFAHGGVFVVAILVHWRTWCELIAIRCGGVAIGWFRVLTTSQRAGRDDRHGTSRMIDYDRLKSTTTWNPCRSGNDSFRSEVLAVRTETRFLLAFFDKVQPQWESHRTLIIAARRPLLVRIGVDLWLVYDLGFGASWIRLFWLAGPHTLAYLNEYDYHHSETTLGLYSIPFIRLYFSR